MFDKLSGSDPGRVGRICNRPKLSQPLRLQTAGHGHSHQFGPITLIRVGRILFAHLFCRKCNSRDPVWQRNTDIGIAPLNSDHVNQGCGNPTPNQGRVINFAGKSVSGRAIFNRPMQFRFCGCKSQDPASAIEIHQPTAHNYQTGKSKVLADIFNHENSVRIIFSTRSIWWIFISKRVKSTPLLYFER